MIRITHFAIGITAVGNVYKVLCLHSANKCCSMNNVRHLDYLRFRVST